MSKIWSKAENKILIMLAFFSISKGLWENFKQLWLQDNNLDVTQISQVLSMASLACVIALIIFSQKLSLDKIKGVLTFSFLSKAICLLLLYLSDHTGQTTIINFLVTLDTIFEMIIIISIYPFIVTIKKDDRLYSKRKLVEYLFSDIGILIGGVFIGKTIGNILVNYNFCLLISIVFLILSFIIILNIKVEKVEAKQISLKEAVEYILKNRIVKIYMMFYLIGTTAMNTGLGLKMLMLTNIFEFSDGSATKYLLIVGLCADIIGILALKYFTLKNDYINITIKFGIRFLLYSISFITNNFIICFIAITWSILISTAYENICDAPYINRVQNDYQMIFTNVRYIVKLIGVSIGMYFAGITYRIGIRYMLGLSAFLMIFQLIISYYLIYLRRKEVIEEHILSEKEKMLNKNR